VRRAALAGLSLVVLVACGAFSTGTDRSCSGSGWVSVYEQPGFVHGGELPATLAAAADALGAPQAVLLAAEALEAVGLMRIDGASDDRAFFVLEPDE
jgi:hypothetical protein